MRRVAIAIVTVFLAGWMCAALCYCVTTEQAPSEVLASPRVRSTPPPLPSFCPPLSEDPVLAPPPPKPLSITDASEPYGCQMLPDYPGCRPWPPLPRCRESDATCGPEYLERSSATYGRYPRVVWQGANGESGAACYSPSAARHPTWGLNPDMVSARYNVYLRAFDACEQDGECQIGGCDGCFSFRRGTVPCGHTLEDVVLVENGRPVPPHEVPYHHPLWCGCVEHRCTIFTQ